MTERPTFGSELRRRRQQAELSLTQLAKQVHYSKGYLSKIESGGKAPNPTLVRLCDAAVGAQGALIAVAAQSSSADTDTDASADLDTGTWQMWLSPGGSGRFGHTDGASVDDTLAFAPTFGADPASVLPLFRAHFDNARSLGQVLSPALVLPGLIGNTHTLTGIARHAPVGDGALWRLAAQFAEFVGWMVQELGEDRTAMWWTTRAVRMAAIGGDESLRPYSLFRRTDITLFGAADPLRTLELAQQAQADPAATARVRGLAAEREAQGYALLGDPDACFRALDRSATLLDEAKQASTGAPVLGTTRTPDPTILARGWCLFDLGRPADAAELLETGIDRFAPGASRARARYAMRTALAHITADEVERACEIVTWLAPDLRQIDSATIRHDMIMVNREFRRRSTQPRVRDILPLFAELLRSQATP
ncbi:MAG TPA: helix-turn-helix transcriptional regulator [Pseudonocardiaceae bacterium]|nr:helix-turn-helix transcriptional regulator [Pseudonocardiaceae bacterium]